MKILVTGTKSGFGKYLSQNLNSDQFFRGCNLINFKKKYDFIIHSAFNPNLNITYNQLESYVNDNIDLTDKLLNLKYNHFIFLSSLAVYPDCLNKKINDRTNFYVKPRDIYATCKLISEINVKRKSKKFTILRTGGLLHKQCRPNSITRLINNKKIKLTLNGKSSFNYILYEDLLCFIKIVLEKKLTGIFNICAKKNVNLEMVKKYFKSNNVTFGNYIYKTPSSIDNSKAAYFLESLKFSSMQNIKRFFEKFKKI